MNIASVFDPAPRSRKFRESPATPHHMLALFRSCGRSWPGACILCLSIAVTSDKTFHYINFSALT